MAIWFSSSSSIVHQRTVLCHTQTATGRCPSYIQHSYSDSNQKPGHSQHHRVSSSSMASECCRAVNPQNYHMYTFPQHMAIMSSLLQLCGRVVEQRWDVSKIQTAISDQTNKHAGYVPSWDICCCWTVTLERKMSFQSLIACQSVVELGAFSHLLLQHQARQLEILCLHAVGGRRTKIAAWFSHSLSPQVIWPLVIY